MAKEGGGGAAAAHDDAELRMPEGDTIFRTAETLRRVLAGKQIVRFTSWTPGINRWDEEDLKDATIAKVEPRGKNLLIHFSNDLILHTHLRMRGSWHVYRPGEKWLKSVRAARVSIEVPDFVAVCFHAPIVRLLRTADLEADRRFRRLGPDPLQQENLDVPAIRESMRSGRGDWLIGDALLSQSVIAGIGNVYKCETLFVESVNPFKKVEELEDPVLERLINTAVALMRRNLGGGGWRRTTRVALQGPTLWVYSRSGKPCLKCGTRIKSVIQGRNSRITYYCPSCQKP